MALRMLFLAALLTAGAGGSQPPTSPKPSSNGPDNRLAAAPAKVTIEGCVVTEAEVGTGKADLGERTGLDKHFVLVNGSIVKGKAPVATAAGAGHLPSTAFRLHGLTDEQVKLHVGHRVRIEGRFADVDASTPAADHEFTKLDVATIRQVPGVCSAPKS